MSLKGHGEQVRCLRMGGKPMSSSLQKGQEGGTRYLQTSQTHLHPWKGDGAAHPGSHLHACGG